MYMDHVSYFILFNFLFIFLQCATHNLRERAAVFWPAQQRLHRFHMALLRRRQQLLFFPHPAARCKCHCEDVL